MTPHNTTKTPIVTRHTTQRNVTQEHYINKYKIRQYNIAQGSTIQHSVAQHSTAQHSTAQHNKGEQHTLQHSTDYLVQEKMCLLLQLFQGVQHYQYLATSLQQTETRNKQSEKAASQARSHKTFSYGWDPRHSAVRSIRLRRTFFTSTRHVLYLLLLTF